MSDNWSPLQTAIFSFVKKMETNLVIVARAGCGKTTTIVECAKYLPQGRVMFCAFNKAIATELATRLPSNVEAKTLHSLGFSMIRKAFRTVRVEENKGKDIARQVVTERLKEANFDLAGKVAKVAALGKNMMVSDAKGLGLLAIDFDIAENGEVGLLSELAQKAIEVSAKNTNVVDFDDMIYFPWKFNLTLPFHDFVIVDEAQDMNAAQLWIARNLAKKGGKMIVVGDDRQAIYGFRGADSKALSRMAKELNATILPLSVTYRCPKSVVAVANGVVADLQAAPSAPVGIVTTVQDAQLRSGAKAGDFVLSRKNAPLMSLCLGFLSQGIPAVIAGRDVAKTLGTLIAKSKAKTVEALITWVGAYRTKEMDRLGRLDPERAEKKIQEANDKCDCILALTEGCDTIGDITKRLETMFADNDPTAKVVLSTVHKAKGLERNRVWVLTDTFRPKKSEEEANLWYVAVTRSKSELYLVAKAD